MTESIVAGGHRRIRPFNTADTYPEQHLSNDLCQAVVAGNTVYLRGQVAEDLDTRESVAIGDPAGQARRVMDNIELLLGEAGAQLDHVVTCTVYLTDIRDREAVYTVLGERMRGVHPCFTGLVVQALARPEWLVEMAAVALDEVMATAAHADYRQLAVIDEAGRTASYSGARTLGRHAASAGRDCLAAGNLLDDEQVTHAMVQAFERRPQDHLAGRLLDALRAGLAAGGEEGPVHSCGLLVVDQVTWPITDLRVDWHADPITELARLWAIWQPQEADYVKRALDPTAAASYG